MGVRRPTALLALATGLVLLGAAAPAWAGDVDGDGVDDALDVCNNTPAGATVDAEGRPLGDIDQDCDTDLEDHRLFRHGFTGPLAPPVVVIDTVPVRDPENAGELSGAGAGADGYGPNRTCGAVDYVYNIGTFEVTAGQYVEFLNAVAGEDAYGLYNTSMSSSIRGCMIRQIGTPGSYTYVVDNNEDDVEDPDWADRPVNYVSWGDAARFCNWLHNGQPTGVQDLTTTEDGSYSLDGAMSDAELLGVARQLDATWVIPSEDEWYKAAYYDGNSGVYHEYTTSSDSVPSNDLIDPDPGNNATFNDGGVYTTGSPYYRTEVGAHENSDSPYGTFDQGGNVWEWTEAILFGSSRGVRGGSYSSNGGHYLHAAKRYDYDPSNEYSNLGFRVAKVP